MLAKMKLILLYYWEFRNFIQRDGVTHHMNLFQRGPFKHKMNLVSTIIAEKQNTPLQLVMRNKDI